MKTFFFVTESGGTGQTYIGLKIINPKKMEILSLGLSFYTDNAYPFPYSIDRTGFENSGLENEKQFLEEIKYSYGYMDEEKKDELIEELNYAEYFWIKNNRHKDHEKLWIKKYRVPSLVQSGQSIKATYEDYENDIFYTSFFKWGVQAYDRTKKETYIIFYPNDNYQWVTELRKEGPYLFLEAGSEGLIKINTETFYIERISRDSSE